MNKIDWSKAPEGATHYAPETHENRACWIIRVVGSSEYVTVEEHKKRPSSFVWLSGDIMESDEFIVPRPQPLTYTQVMFEAGELPPIGSKVQFVGNDDYLVEFSIVDGDEIECICHTTDFEGESIGVYRHKDGYSVSILTQLVKPLTEPIELIDRTAYQFEVRGETIQGVYDKHKRTLNIHQGYYFDLVSCTNIQQLTVKE